MRVRAILASLIFLTATATARPAILMSRPPVMRPSISARQADFAQMLAKLRVAEADKQTALGDFAKLPPGAQELALSIVETRLGMKSGGSGLSLPRKTPGPHAPSTLPRVDAFYPTKGTPGEWSAVTGSSLNNDCKVNFDGIELPSAYCFGGLCFQVPTDKQLGTDHAVFVHDTKQNTNSATKQYRVAAHMGYRGVNGWRFGNFSTPYISYEVFRDYFGASQVEYANGYHIPSVWEWYIWFYRQVGDGGDCHGMSLRSVRTKLSDWQGLYGSWWPANTQPTVWDYAWVDPQIVDSIREDQGGQTSGQAMALISTRSNHQTNNQAWELIRDALLTGDPRKQPIVVITGSLGAHVVVAYRVNQTGDDRAVYLYDCNKPYRETEPGDNSIAHVQQSTDTFSYGSYDKLNAYTFDELVYEHPNLPSTAIPPGLGALGSDVTVVVAQSPGAMKQITDEAGRTFFAGNQPNTNRATRIPDSMRFVPLTGGPVPPGFPAVFVFGKSVGKSLTFDLQQTSPSGVRIFSPGIVTIITAQTGRFQINGILTPNQELRMINPNGMNLGEIRFFSTQADRSERVFEVQGLKGIQGRGFVGLGIGPSGGAVSITGDCGAQLRMNVKSYSRSGVQESALPNLSIPPNQRGLINIRDWANLRSSPPKLELQSR